MTEQSARLPQLLSVDEFARALGVSRRSVFTWIGRGQIQSVRLGRVRRIRLDELERVCDRGVLVSGKQATGDSVSGSRQGVRP
jgi:excisionase family DNA binding protein